MPFKLVYTLLSYDITSFSSDIYTHETYLNRYVRKGPEALLLQTSPEQKIAGCLEILIRLPLTPWKNCDRSWDSNSVFDYISSSGFWKYWLVGKRWEKEPHLSMCPLKIVSALLAFNAGFSLQLNVLLWRFQRPTFLSCWGFGNLRAMIALSSSTLFWSSRTQSSSFEFWSWWSCLTLCWHFRHVLSCIQTQKCIFCLQWPEFLCKQITSYNA